MVDDFSKSLIHPPSPRSPTALSSYTAPLAGNGTSSNKKTTDGTMWWGLFIKAGVFGVAAAVYWYTQLRSPPLPVPIISTPDHQTCIKNICDVYWDFLSYSTATQVPTLYEALGLDKAQNPGVVDVWSALQHPLEGLYHANGAPAGDDGPSVGSLHGAGGKGKEYSGGHGDDGEASLGPRSPPMAPQASEVWTQIGNILMDSKLRSTYDRTFLPVLTGLGVDRKAALSNICLWDTAKDAAR